MNPDELRKHMKVTGKPVDIRNRDITEEQREQDERIEVDHKNRAALVELMLRYNIVIPYREFATWRPTVPSEGSIPGVWDSVSIIATNGILGWFIDCTDEVLCGHIHKFSGKVKPLFSVTKPKTDKPKKPRKKSARQQLLDSI